MNKDFHVVAGTASRDQRCVESAVPGLKGELGIAPIYTLAFEQTAVSVEWGWWKGRRMCGLETKEQ